MFDISGAETLVVHRSATQLIDRREPFAVPENDRLDVVPVASDDSRRADRSADQDEVIRVYEY